MLSETREQQVYGDIIDGAFARHFPQWRDLSTSDPVRLFAESMQESLAALEARQQRLTNVLLDCLPSLVGVEPKMGKLARAIVSIVPSAKLKKTELLPAGTLLRFHKDSGDLFLKTLHDIAVNPNSDSNTGEVELQLRVADKVLGVLQGDPWEVLPLPSDLGAIPDTIVLRLPDESTVELKRGQQSLLRLRHSDSDGFRRLFFYNPISHALIVPAANELLQGYGGGVRVEAVDVILDSGLNLLPLEAVYAPEHPKVIAAVEWVRTLHARIERESTGAYLERFYALVKKVALFQGQIFDAHALCQELVAQVPRAQAIECDIVDREITFFVLGDAQGICKDEQTALESQVRRLARESVPLHYTIRVAPFRRTPLSFSGGDSSLESVSALVQPPPLGQLEPRTLLEPERAARTLQTDPDQLQWIVGSEGVIRRSLRRLPGELFEVQAHV